MIYWIFLVIFSLSLLGIFHTYIGYPLSLSLLRNKVKFFLPNSKDYYPTVEVIFAAYNEESVIEEKIHSLFNTNYPIEKLFVHVGSDLSTDQTHKFLENLTKTYPNLRFSINAQRTGKAGTINRLVQESSAEILIPTDANIIFTPNTIGELVYPFQDESIGIVGGIIRYNEGGHKGIAQQEETYLNLENQIKVIESTRWGMAMGVEGGCYAIRRKAFPMIPPLTFMEDFYVSLKTLESNKRVVYNPKALVWEDVSTQLKEEFKRKTRISIGNFQNLFRFKHLLLEKPYPLGYLFLSHKILRWFTPILLITLFSSTIILSFYSTIFQVILSGQLLILLLIGLEMTLSKMNVNFKRLRFLSHFTMMNFALLWGFVKYIKGVKSNVWQPTQRNQN